MTAPGAAPLADVRTGSGLGRPACAAARSFFSTSRYAWLLLAAALLCGFSLPATGQSLAATSRSVYGRVLSPSGALQPNAVVYLENEKDQNVKTYITAQDGAYRFVQLNPNVNYQIWAKYKNMKSRSRTISSFESRHNFQFDLKLEREKSS